MSPNVRQPLVTRMELSFLYNSLQSLCCYTRNSNKTFVVSLLWVRNSKIKEINSEKRCETRNICKLKKCREKARITQTVSQHCAVIVPSYPDVFSLTNERRGETWENLWAHTLGPLNAPIQPEAAIEVLSESLTRRPHKRLLIGSARSKDLTCAPRTSVEAKRERTSWARKPLVVVDSGD